MADKYIRTPGGEKTAKSGQKWTKQELARVLAIYDECHDAIHERNPKIQSVAGQLGRAVRAVENQLLMFRALEKVDQGEVYSRRHKSKFCVELWEDRKSRGKKLDVGKPSTNPDETVGSSPIYYLSRGEKPFGPYVREDVLKFADDAKKHTLWIYDESSKEWIDLRRWLAGEGVNLDEKPEAIHAEESNQEEDNDSINVLPEPTNSAEIEGLGAPGNEKSFPEAFYGWSASTVGGVRRPFHEKSGRPVGFQIETPILKRLKKLSKDICSKKTKCRALFLLGGPGNGKTDSIETFIRSLDEDLHLENDLVAGFKDEFESESPRYVEVQVPLKGGNDPRIIESIVLIQDASQGSDSSKRSYELLVDELQSLVDKDASSLFLFCINRGIFDRARHNVLGEKKHEKVSALLESMSGSISPSPELKCPWPLSSGDMEGIYAWPMDVDSLLQREEEEGFTVFEEVIENAVSGERWAEGYDKPDCCVFSANRDLLQEPTNRRNLNKLLDHFQAASSKRWSFREIFSLIAYLIAGEEKKLIIDDERVTPREYSEKCMARINSGQPKLAVPASLNLLKRLYYHQLFYRFPNFSNAKKACENYFGIGAENFATALFNSLESGTESQQVTAAKTIGFEFQEMLDPALCDSESWEIDGVEGVNTMLDIEKELSVSLKGCYDKISVLLHGAEKHFFECLVKAEESLRFAPEKSKKNQLTNARVAINAVRKIASILIKRSLGVRRGMGRESETISEFLKLMSDKRERNSFRSLLKKYVSRNGQLSVPLDSIIGQPVKSSDDQVKFMCEEPSFKDKQIPVGENYPFWKLSYLSVELDNYSLPIPITYSLFKAMRSLHEGELEACLPPEEIVGIDNMLSIMGGRIVRDPKYVDDEDSYICVCTDRIKAYEGEYEYISGGLGNE